MKNFIAHTDETRNQMLESIDCKTIEDLFKQVPVKFKDFKIDNPLSEIETQKKLKALARKNSTEKSCFIGGGIYNKFIPAAVNYIAQRMNLL